MLFKAAEYGLKDGAECSFCSNIPVDIYEVNGFSAIFWPLLKAPSNIFYAAVRQCTVVNDIDHSYPRITIDFKSFYMVDM